MSRSQITTHVLDAARGTPAVGLAVELRRRDGGGDGWTMLARAETDDDGRVNSLGPERVAPGEYRLRFDTGAYFAARGTPGFYPEVLITFTVDEEGRHHHVPILLSPFAYSTYRGS
ncbi:hydroxyisourate hydrolase [Agromyces sp. NPDC058104]|uniref:hydroxyisourate hydrolase n=1 Tax=Agromyces sp. NPDC058104 TaxID=3346342 RepID=UPI0036DC0E36